MIMIYNDNAHICSDIKEYIYMRMVTFYFFVILEEIQEENRKQLDPSKLRPEGNLVAVGVTEIQINFER